MALVFLPNAGSSTGSRTFLSKRRPANPVLREKLPSIPLGSAVVSESELSVALRTGDVDRAVDWEAFEERLTGAYGKMLTRGLEHGAQNAARKARLGVVIEKYNPDQARDEGGK